MNRRGKRLALGVMAMGLAAVIVLAVANWGTVRDHVEAWRFQLTRETVTMDPGDVIVRGHERRGGRLLELLGGILEGLDVQTGDQVIYEPVEAYVGGMRAAHRTQQRQRVSCVRTASA